jgi:hypothetical protein
VGRDRDYYSFESGSDRAKNSRRAMSCAQLSLNCHKYQAKSQLLRAPGWRLLVACFRSGPLSSCFSQPVLNYGDHQGRAKVRRCYDSSPVAHTVIIGCLQSLDLRALPIQFAGSGCRSFPQ